MNNELIEKILRVKKVTCTPDELYDLAAELTLANKKLELLQASNDHYANRDTWGNVHQDLYIGIDNNGFDFARKAQEEIARLEGENG